MTFYRGERKRIQKVFDPAKGRAKQAAAEECDINKIMEKHLKKGVPLPESTKIAHYGDFTAVPDFFSAQNQIAEAHNAFSLLPAKVREKFGNDPAQFVDFCDSARNGDAVKGAALIEMGFAQVRETPKDDESSASSKGGKGTPAKSPKAKPTGHGEGEGGTPSDPPKGGNNS